MTSITYVGLDVHTTNYTVCCYSMQDDQVFTIVQMEPDYKNILKYLNRVNSQHGSRLKFLCGYEAGCLGYSLYHVLTSHGVDCVILAPSTMANTKGNQIKTDRRDAKNIAKCLAYHLYNIQRIGTSIGNGFALLPTLLLMCGKVPQKNFAELTAASLFRKSMA